MAYMDKSIGRNQIFVGLAKREVIDDIYLQQEIIDNLVYEAIQAFYEGSNTQFRNFDDVIRPQSRILIKPNYVRHQNYLRYQNSKDNQLANECFITQSAVIKSILKMLACTNPKQVIIGDAPIQHCQFHDIVTDEYQRDLVKDINYNIQFIDFRRTVLSADKNKRISIATDMNSATDYIDFDLKSESLLEEIIKYYKVFRVTDYPPEKMLEFHGPQKHIYRIHRAAIDVDYIFTIPKLKTHMKAGITGALKGFIGVIGNKECLPHHRRGFPLVGGDCYQESSPMKLLIEVIKDKANSYLHSDLGLYNKWNYFAIQLINLRKHFGRDNEMSGSWSGNDTLWRTILDIDRIITYGCSDGTMANVPQRRIFSLVDAVIAGQGQGPMRPEPFPLGVITFTDSLVASDYVNCELLGFDPHKILQLLRSSENVRWPLALQENEIIVRNNGNNITLSEVHNKFGGNASPPLKWESMCEIRKGL